MMTKNNIFIFEFINIIKMNESNDHNNDFDANLSSVTKTKSKETNSSIVFR